MYRVPYFDILISHPGSLLCLHWSIIPQLCRPPLHVIFMSLCLFVVSIIKRALSSRRPLASSHVFSPCNHLVIHHSLANVATRSATRLIEGFLPPLHSICAWSLTCVLCHYSFTSFIYSLQYLFPCFTTRDSLGSMFPYTIELIITNDLYGAPGGLSIFADDPASQVSIHAPPCETNYYNSSKLSEHTSVVTRGVGTKPFQRLDRTDTRCNASSKKNDGLAGPTTGLGN
jgi:hypothetical protein